MAFFSPARPDLDRGSQRHHSQHLTLHRSRRWPRPIALLWLLPGLSGRFLRLLRVSPILPVVLSVLFLMGLSSPSLAGPVLLMEVNGAIGPATSSYVLTGLERAKVSEAPLVVISMDTPGGLDTAMRQIIQGILASPVPVAVYVSPEGARAASAGTYILYAAHVAAMTPTATLGAATPVAIGMPGSRPGEEEGPRPGGRDDAPNPQGRSAEQGSEGRDVARGNKDRDIGNETQRDRPRALGGSEAITAKQVNDAAAFIRSLAQQRGRNAEWAERAVREAVSLTAQEAARGKVIDFVARDVQDLLRQADGRVVKVQGADRRLATQGVTTEALLPNWRQRLLFVISNPSLAMILLMVGFYGLVLEFSSPGFGIPGIAGAISLLMALFALQMLPVNYAGVALILLGMALLAAELLSPSFGVLGAGGVIAFVAGGLLLFDRGVPGFSVPLPLILGLALGSVLLILGGGNMALRARRRPVVSGQEDMRGAIGRVVSIDHDGEAWAEVHGERWRVRRAVSTARTATNAGPEKRADPLQPGQRVQVLGTHGLTLDVQLLDESNPEA